MITVGKINSVQVPNSWDDITLATLIRIEQFWASIDGDMLPEQAGRYIAAVLGENESQKLLMSDLPTVTEALTFLSAKPEPTFTTFVTIRGEKYSCLPNLLQMSLSQFTNLSHTQKTVHGYAFVPYLLATLYFKESEKYEDTHDIADLRRRVFLQTKATDVFGVQSFFLLLSKSLEKGIPAYLTLLNQTLRDVEKWVLTFQRSMVGYPSYTNSPITT